jgi:hypothetical protein
MGDLKWFVYYSASHENWIEEYDSELKAIEAINDSDAERKRLKLDPVDSTLIKGEEIELVFNGWKWRLKEAGEF